MNAIWPFVRQAGIVFVAMAVLGSYPLYNYGGFDLLLAGGVGAAICAVNALAGCAVALWALEKSQAIFLQALLGGMGIRLMAIGAIFFVLVRFTEIRVLGLTLSMFLFYVVFQFLEIRFLLAQSRLKSRQGV